MYVNRKGIEVGQLFPLEAALDIHDERIITHLRLPKIYCSLYYTNIEWGIKRDQTNFGIVFISFLKIGWFSAVNKSPDNTARVMCHALGHALKKKEKKTFSLSVVLS